MQKIKSKLSKKHQTSNTSNSSSLVPSAETVGIPQSNQARVESVVEPVGPYKESHENNVNASRNTIQNAAQSIPNTNLHRVSVEPQAIQRIEKPMVVKERIHPVEKEEIQPIIHREREQIEIIQVTQPSRELHVAPIVTREGSALEPQMRQTLVERSAVPIEQNVVLPSRNVAPLQTEKVLMEPILKETIQKTIIEEITPFVKKETFAPKIIETTQHIYEKTAQAPIYYRSELPARQLQTIYGSGMAPMEVMRGPYYADYASRSLWEKEVTMGGNLSSHFERQVNVQRADNFVSNVHLPHSNSTYSSSQALPLSSGMNGYVNQAPSSFVQQERMIQNNYNNQMVGIHQGKQTSSSFGIPMSVTAQPNGGFKDYSYQTSGTAMGPFSAR